MKRFIHFGYVAWVELEEGVYTLEDDSLKLVKKKENSDFNNQVYIFSLKNDSIIDIDKYGNEIK